MTMEETGLPEEERERERKRESMSWLSRVS